MHGRRHAREEEMPPGFASFIYMLILAIPGALGGAYRDDEAEHRHIVRCQRYFTLRSTESEWEVLDGRLLAPTTEQET